MIFNPLTPKSSAAEINPTVLLTQASTQNKLSIWSLGRKMMVGYGLAFAITIAGIVAGFTVSRNMREKALAFQLETTNDVRTISRLKGSLIELILHQHAVAEMVAATAIEDQTTLQQEFRELAGVYKRFQQDWQSLQASDEFRQTEGGDNGIGPTETEEQIVNAILREHGTAALGYQRQFDELLQQVDLSNLTPEDRDVIQARLTLLQQSDFITSLDAFVAKLTALAQAVEEEQTEALMVSQQASEMQVTIMVISIALSGAIGALMMGLFSRIFLRPLQATTQTVQQSIRDANFDLQVPVFSQDEVGLLAQTFNAYLKFVKQLLAQHQATNHQLQTTLDELHRTQGQMLQSEKMSSLGQLVAGVAHEINNPVNFIHGNLKHVQDYARDLLGLMQLYQHHYPHPSTDIQAETEVIDLEFIRADLPKILASMEMGSERIREIVRSLRNFSRLDEAEIKLVDVHDGLNSTLMILQHRLKASAQRSEIQVIKDYAVLPPVECYAGALNQVFMNILSNAIDALDEISTKRIDGSPAPLNSHITLRTSLLEHPSSVSGSRLGKNQTEQWVQIAIADNGPGIPLAIQSRIFDPFFTTKPVGKGTGMGMAISYQVIVERHQGKLECLSTPGEGTEFMIQIPMRQPVNNSHPSNDRNPSLTSTQLHSN